LLTKPFDSKELVAHLPAVRRRAAGVGWIFLQVAGPDLLCVFARRNGRAERHQPLAIAFRLLH
jgi:hypothetical protein